MKLDELTDLITEDLNAQIGCVRLENDVFIIEFECDDPKEIKRRHFIFNCSDVIESNVAPRWVGSISSPKEHVLLLQHSADFVRLAFSGAPANAREVVSRLYESHLAICGDWRPLSKYVNHGGNSGIITLLEEGFGVIADGPTFIVEAYNKSISGLLKTSLIRTPHKLQKSKSYSILFFDEHYIICESFTLSETTKQS